ncbi:MAG: sn-glycerol-3-phosphate ABC transporter ATP-binding protein UgpC [Pseudomonadota bacterium]
MSDLKLTSVAKSYGEVEVLRDINLDIKQGELIVFVGPSGCGKSTLLRMIAGLEKITGGDLHIDGERVNDTPPSQRGIAMVFQSYALYPHMTVRDNMAFALKIAKKSKADIDAAVENAARILQLTPYLDRLPKALSGGQRQRVAIGRAIVRDPKVFLFDEPLSNLDAALRVATRLEIAQLKAEMPEATMIYVTHDQVEAMTLASRIVVLNGGNVEQVGAPLELYERPANEFVAKFIGSPAMNLFQGEVVETGAATTVKLSNGRTIESSIATHGGLAGRPVSVGVRPEHLKLAQDSAASFAGPVKFVEALGEVTLIHASGDADDLIVAKLPGIHKPGSGDVLPMGADAADVHLFADGVSLRE